MTDKAAVGVRVRPFAILDDETGKPVMVDRLDADGKPTGERAVARQSLRNPARRHGFISAEGETLPMNAWLLRMIRQGNLEPINEAGDAIEVDDFGNEVEKPSQKPEDAPAPKEAPVTPAIGPDSATAAPGASAAPSAPTSTPPAAPSAPAAS